MTVCAGVFTTTNSDRTIWGGDLVNRPTVAVTNPDTDSLNVMSWQGAYALGDIDGDSDPDIVGPNFQFYRNDGNKVFTDAGSLNPESSDAAWAGRVKNVVDLVVADFSGDVS